MKIKVFKTLSAQNADWYGKQVVKPKATKYKKTTKDGYTLMTRK